MALATTDTVYNNITRMRSGHVAVYNECVDSTSCKNGIINNMHPAEGLWIYKGTCRSSGGTLGFGFGDQRTCGIFPSGTFIVNKAHKDTRLSTVLARNSENVISYGGAKLNTKEYSWPDENLFQVLQDMAWDRNNSIVELIPIVVAVTR
jgi:hypothetical protein